MTLLKMIDHNGKTTMIKSEYTHFEVHTMGVPNTPIMYACITDEDGFSFYPETLGFLEIIDEDNENA